MSDAEDEMLFKDQKFTAGSDNNMSVAAEADRADNLVIKIEDDGEVDYQFVQSDSQSFVFDGTDRAAAQGSNGCKTEADFNGHAKCSACCVAGAAAATAATGAAQLSDSDFGDPTIA